MESAAKSELARIASEGLDAFRESLWLASLTYLTDACAAVGDETVAALLYPELAPLAGSNVMVGHLSPTTGRPTATWACSRGRSASGTLAEEHFEQALAANLAMEAKTWLAHTNYEYARMLLVVGTRTATARRRCLSRRDRLARLIGMASLRNRITAMQGRPPGRRGRAGLRLPDALSGREAQILRLVARGLSNREIGAELYISEHTAANHVRSILRKTGCANRTEAASYAHRHALADA